MRAITVDYGVGTPPPRLLHRHTTGRRVPDHARMLVLAHILSGNSAAQTATRIGVTKSYVLHIVSGRKKPSPSEKLLAFVEEQKALLRGPLHRSIKFRYTLAVRGDTLKDFAQRIGYLPHMVTRTLRARRSMSPISAAIDAYVERYFRPEWPECVKEAA